MTEPRSKRQAAVEEPMAADAADEPMATDAADEPMATADEPTSTVDAAATQAAEPVATPQVFPSTRMRHPWRSRPAIT